MPSLNGLVDINADNVNSTTIVSDEINSKNVDTETLFVDGLNLGEQVNINAQKLTAITYTATPTPLTTISSDVSIPNGGMDLTGTMIIRGSSDPSNNNMSLYYDPAYFGFRFKNNRPGAYMYFSVLDNYGNLKNFQFNYSQTYSNIPMYVDNWLNVSYNNDLTFGDNNSSNWYGSRAKFIPSSSPTAGFVFYTKGFNNNTAYYTNFTHNNLSNVETPTFRMNYGNIWSLVKHTFEMDASMNSNLSVAGTSTLKQISGTTLNITGTSNFGNTITADSLSVYNGTNLNGNLNAISTSNFIGQATFSSNLIANANIHANTFDCSNNAIFNGAVTCNNSLSSGALTCTNLTATSNILCSSFRTTGNAQIDGNLTVNGFIHNIAGLITFTGPMSTYSITSSSRIIQTSSLATDNKITQTRISGDTTGNANILKYTQVRFNSNSALGTSSAGIQVIDDFNGAQLVFIPNSGSGSYNNMVNKNDRIIASIYGDGSPSCLDLISYGASAKHGIKIFHDSSSNSTVSMLEGNYNFKVNNLTGVTASSGVTSSATGEFNIVNSAGRGLQLNSNSTASATNNLVALNDSVITTQTQNNSSLVITNYGTVKSGLKISTTASTNANVGLYCKNSYLKMSASAVVESMDFASEIITHTTTSGYSLSSPEVTLQTTNDSYPCKYRALNHEFSSKNGGDGCTVNIRGNLSLARSDSSYNYITSSNNIVLSTTSGQSNNYWASTHNFRTIDASGMVDLSGNTVISIRGNVTLHGSGNLTFPNSSIQNTAFTNANSDKLNAIGTIVSSTLNATATLTTNTIFDCGSISLTAGTWSVSVNCCVAVIVGTTTVGELLAGYSKSSSGLSQSTNLSIINAGNFTYNNGNQWCLTSTNTIVVSSTTTYYMILRCLFGTASRLQFVSTNSAFQATRIA